MVVVFCGRALALDKDTMLDGSAEEKQAHLMGVLGEFLEERVQQIVNMISSVNDEDLQQLIDQDLGSARLVTASDQLIKHRYSYYLVHRKTAVNSAAILQFKDWLISQLS